MTERVQAKDLEILGVPDLDDLYHVWTEKNRYLIVVYSKPVKHRIAKRNLIYVSNFDTIHTIIQKERLKEEFILADLFKKEDEGIVYIGRYLHEPDQTVRILERIRRDS